MNVKPNYRSNIPNASVHKMIFKIQKLYGNIVNANKKPGF